MSATKLKPVPAEPTVAESDQSLLDELASELECDPEPEAIAARITDLVAFEERVKEAAEADTAAEVVDKLADAQDDKLSIIALEALQAALDLSDADVQVIAQSSIPEFAARTRLAGLQAGPASPLRVFVQTTIRSLTSRSA